MTRTRTKLGQLIPIMFTFFVMGYVDLAGTATNYVKTDFHLSDTMANFLPSMVFLWFFFLSVPTSLLMSRIGKKNVVLVSLAVTVLGLILPLVGYTYPIMLVSLCLLGIGNTLMQVSLNPLVSCIVSGDKLASSLTFGQFVKAIASFIAPILASWAAVAFGNWRILFAIFLVLGVIATAYLFMTKIDEDAPSAHPSTFGQVVRLLGKPAVLMLFIGIMCHVGIDVGVNTSAPKILMERLGMPLTSAAIATSVYFLFRTLGCLTGSVILSRWDAKKFFGLSVAMITLAMVGMFFCHSKAGLYVAFALVGYGNSNVFPIIFSKALLSMPDKKDEVSGLMIMGLIGGTVFPMLMGILSDALGGQIGSVIVMSLGAVYLIFLSFRFRQEVETGK